MTEQEIEALKLKYRAEYNPDRPLTHMPFGQFKGERICDLPTYYLAWVLHKCNPRPNLLVPVAQVLKQRAEAEKSKVCAYVNDNAIGD